MAVFDLESKLGVRFRQTRLLHQALTHKSAVNEGLDAGVGDNERLEFLGDAILGVVVAEVLFRSFREAQEGALTNMRAELVRESGLADWARRFSLGSYVVLGRGEDERGGRERDHLLSSTFEAVVGALFLDRGMSAVRRLVRPLVLERIAGSPGAAPLRPARQPLDPKSELQRRAQMVLGALPSYHLLELSGPDHRPTFHVEVELSDGRRAFGMGPSKQAAEREAARRLLEGWEA